MSLMRYPCPCCGYRTFAYPTGGSMDLCPVCGWEDIYGLADLEGARELPLAQNQRRYLATGVGNEDFHGELRAPLPEEARSADWVPFDELRLRTIREIEAAFHEVRRDRGTTLHQMHFVDGGYSPEGAEMKEAGKEDPEIHWQEISAAKLSRFSQSMVFLDDPGFRFYLPAFMRHALVTCAPDVSHADLDGVLWALDEGPEHHLLRNLSTLLSNEQKIATASFVFLIATYGDGIQAQYAIKGLKKGWDAFVPNLLKDAIR